MAQTEKSLEEPMKWYHYIAAFFAGLFLTNVVPHFVNGISGNPFPTPFSHPPGKGLSSPLTNVLWALFNLVAGYLLFRVSRINSKRKLGLFIFLIGVILISVMCSITFMDKAK
jgi:drug/metabolite transporter (DMT)-like permease